MPGRVLILGAKESGTGAALLAQARGWEVLVSDASTSPAPHREQLLRAGIELEEGSHQRAAAFEPELIVKSPGIPDTVPVIRQLTQQGSRLISEIEFAASYSQATIIGITGSNGKTTTTALTGHILQKAGLDVLVAGNIGNSFSAAVAERDPAYAVLEISSFQLDNVQDFRPHIAVLLNITPDHLDRYSNSMDLYAASKLRIAAHQQPSDYFIYCSDDPVSREKVAAADIKSHTMTYGMEKSSAQHAWIEEQQLIVNNGLNPFSMSIYELGLQGKHNLYNSMAASIAASVLDIRKDVIREGLMDFRTLEHRLERVGKVNGVEYINDSKATNVNSVWYALESMDKPVIWIAGGVDKGNDYSLLNEMVRQKVKAVICLGLDNRKLHEAFSRQVDLMVNTRSMVEAVRMANHLSNSGDVVLLSPACASFDLFSNYEDRGHQFKAAVKGL